MIEVGNWVECGGVVYRMSVTEGGNGQVHFIDVKTGVKYQRSACNVTVDGRPRATVLHADRDDGYRFYFITWRERGRQRVVVVAGCRFVKGVRAALARWAPAYRVDEYAIHAIHAVRARRRALNMQSRQIVTALAKLAGCRDDRTTETFLCRDWRRAAALC